MSMISFSSSCLVVQTLLLEDFSVIMIVWSFSVGVAVKSRKDLTHYFVVEFNGLLQLTNTLHQLHKEHGLSVLFAFFSYKNGITHEL